MVMDFDFTPLFRSTIGFDRLARMVDSATRFESVPAYPPYNIEKTGEDAYRLTMAVAGFSRDEIDITAQENTLTVTGKAQKEEANDSGRYLHRGIARRAFERRFSLADHIKVTGASLDNGLLHVDLVREVPEAAKPRQIKIEAVQPAQPQVAEQKAA
jgi:molecular chaperone IbpA